MKFAIAFLLALFVAGALVAPASAGAPIPGVYKSTDIGGTMQPGRYSESWTVANGHLTLGNTTNKYSWDGFTLGAEWWMYCAQISQAPLLLQDTVDTNGNGIRQYQVVYTGGLCVLSGTGPWGGGDPSYTAPYTSYSEIKTFHYTNNVITAVIGTAQLQAEVLVYEDCMTLSIANHSQDGDTDSAALPANYPGFLNPNTCTATRTLGSWGEADEFTLVITGTCTVPVEESTWSRIKDMYKND